SPAWSSRSPTIAYIGLDDALYTAPLGLAPHRLPPEGIQSFSWSPDGRRIAVERWSGTVAVVDAATGATKEVAAGADPVTARWSADGTRIYFVAGKVFAYVPASGGAIRTFGQVTGPPGQVEVSPSGSRLALVSAGHLTVATLDGDVVSDLGDGNSPSW